MQYLTVDLVEKLQTAVERQRPVESIVGNLTSATVPGILEFGCLRHSHPSQIPPLPAAITNSGLGMSLSQVRSKLGLRDTGADASPIRSLQPLEIEFCLMATEDQIISTAWDNYCVRFERGAKQAGFPAKTAENLHLALYEMASNAVVHAFSTEPALIAYQIGDGFALFCVVDVGIGVLESLRSASKFSQLSRSVDAIHQAIRPGVTRMATGGNGFNDVFKAIAGDWGQLRFRSGDGCVTMDGTGLSVECDQIQRTYPPKLPGFQVSVCCRLPRTSTGAPVF